MGGGEIDVVASRRDVLAIVEVRTRRYDSVVRPEDSLTRDKRRHIERAAREVAMRRPGWVRDRVIRFDIMAVVVWIDGTGSVATLPPPEAEAAPSFGQYRLLRVTHLTRAFDPERPF